MICVFDEDARLYRTCSKHRHRPPANDVVDEDRRLDASTAHDRSACDPHRRRERRHYAAPKAAAMRAIGSRVSGTNAVPVTSSYDAM
jgi:hypothetical protein